MDYNAGIADKAAYNREATNRGWTAFYERMSPRWTTSTPFPRCRTSPSIGRRYFAQSLGYPGQREVLGRRLRTPEEALDRGVTGQCRHGKMDACILWRK